MITVIILASLFVSGWGQDPPDFSSTCSFTYFARTMGGRATPMIKGMFGAIYDKDEGKRMQVINQTETMNGTKQRHDYFLDRMDLGVEYYMNWTIGKPKYCGQESDPYVEELWTSLDEYKFNGTHSMNGTTLNIWVLKIDEGEMLVIGMSPDDNTKPVIFEEVTKQRQGMVRTTYMIKNFTNNPNKKIFDVPKLCQQRETVFRSKMASRKMRRSMRRRSRLPFVRF